MNIVVMSAPPRHDLLPSSCVNSEVIRVNNQLRKRLSQFNNVKILETDIEREYFSKHGQHLNSSGKEYIAVRLATVVKSFSHIKRMSPIPLPWEGDTVSTIQGTNNVSSVSSNKDETTPHTQPPLSPTETSANEDTDNRTPIGSKRSIHNEEKKSNRPKKSPHYQKRGFFMVINRNKVANDCSGNMCNKQHQNNKQ